MTVDLHAITMPKWGLAMDEGMVVDWHVEEGARLGIGDEVVDIETTKITNALESPAGGILCRRLVAEGETVPVGALLGVIAAGAAEAAEIAAGTAEIDAFIARFEAAFAVAAAEAATETASAPEIVEAAGWRLNYQRAGEGAGGSETAPMVLVHGFGGDLDNWMFNRPALAAGRRVCALDLPGHGGSSKDVGDGSLDTLTDVLAGFMSALGIERAHLVGHSLGGAVALACALARPRTVASLSLLASAGLGREINAGYIDGFVAAERRKDMKPVLQELFADPALVSRQLVDDVLKAKRIDGASEALAALAAKQFPGGAQGPSLAERGGELAMPLQVIWGAADRIIPPDHAGNLAGAKVTILDGVGHMPHMEAAATVNGLILDLIDAA